MPLDPEALSAAIQKAREDYEKRKFTQSIDLIVSMKDIDMKSPEGRIQERVELPHLMAGTQNKICVVATRGLALKAKKAKADLVMGKDELEALGGKKKDLRRIANEYRFFVAEAPLMSLVARIMGPALGPRGKMPVPVPPSSDISALLGKLRRTVSIRMRNQPVVQCRVGSEAMKDEEITENIQAVLRVLEGKLKRGGKSIRASYLKTSMGKPVKIG